jgi:hypothetical protein
VKFELAGGADRTGFAAVVANGLARLKPLAQFDQRAMFNSG